MNLPTGTSTPDAPEGTDAFRQLAELEAVRQFLNAKEAEINEAEYSRYGTELSPPLPGTK